MFLTIDMPKIGLEFDSKTFKIQELLKFRLT